MIPIEATYCLLGISMLLVTLLYLFRKLDETRSEIEELKREVFQTNQFLRHVVLEAHHPELSDAPVIELEVDEERVRKSSLGKMLETAKENARLNPRL